MRNYVNILQAVCTVSPVSTRLTLIRQADAEFRADSAAVQQRSFHHASRRRHHRTPSATLQPFDAAGIAPGAFRHRSLPPGALPPQAQASTRPPGRRHFATTSPQAQAGIGRHWHLQQRYRQQPAQWFGPIQAAGNNAPFQPPGQQSVALFNLFTPFPSGRASGGRRAFGYASILYWMGVCLQFGYNGVWRRLGYGDNNWIAGDNG